MFNSILPGTDNLFKYILTIGCVFIFFAVVYPLQKEQDLKIEELDIRMKSEQIGAEISSLRKSVNELERERDAVAGKLNHLKKLLITASGSDSVRINSEIKDLTTPLIEKKKNLKIIGESLKQKEIQNRFDIEKYLEVSKQVKRYFWYKTVFILLGVLFSIIGLRYWLSSTYVDEVKRNKELGFEPPYESYFVRSRTTLRTNKIIKFVFRIKE